MNPYAWNLSDLATVDRTGLRCMSTFSCGGGSSMGYKRAGYEVVLANDIDLEMAWHYKTNLHPRDHVLCPIKDLVSKLPQDLFGVDLLDGSPPCSSFSTIGSREKAWGQNKHFREGQVAQVLDDLFFDFIAVAEAVRPRALIAENVTGLMKGNAKGYLTMIFARLRAIGYRPQMFLLDASRCGVPQKRERVFICAQRDDQSSHQLRIETATALISAQAAISDLVLTEDEITETAFTGVDLKFWHLIKPGEAYGKASPKGGYFGHIRLHPLTPAPTLTANPALFTHWSQARKLSFREWKRLGSFPDDYVAKTPNLGKYLVGMSVPPKMAEVVAAAVRDQWLM